MKIQSLEDLLIHELKDALSAEKQLLEALPKMAAAASDGLKALFEEHLKETETHVERLGEALTKLGKPVRSSKCEAMEGLISEGEEVIEAKMDPAVKDAALIAAAQRVEHYEIAVYGCARTFAEMEGHAEIVELLELTLEEEKSADKKLTEFALAHANVKAQG